MSRWQRTGNNFLHHKICQQDSTALHLLFPDQPVSPFFKKSSGSQRGVGTDHCRARRLLQSLTESGGNALPLKIFMYIEPVQIRRIHVQVGEAQEPLSILRFLVTLSVSYLLMAGMICMGIWFPVRKAVKMAPAEALHYE